MKVNNKILLGLAMLATATFAFTACGDDDPTPNTGGNSVTEKEAFLQNTNKNLVNETILPI
ncbi:MAG: hypothetical protein IJ528_00690, partial [Bacteroidaceae bacterium]|nr:hypothetical protein [Bacteroidaceae bacterium]